MGYLALYRRYRPTTFDGIIGQDHIVKTLTNQIKSDRLGHAYLFTGTRGTGKTSTAKIFAKAINCKSPINGSPCGKCESCIALSDPSNIDVIEIDAASNNGVNEIRDLREKVQYPPVSCSKKVYIIDEVHMLTGPAFNALLKTLEEPPKHVVFILATTEVHKIPATILSRCMRFDFRLVSTETISKLISEIFDKEGKKYQGQAVTTIAKAGEGSIRDALSIADIAINCGDEILTYEDVCTIIGSSNSALINSFVSSLLQGNTGKIMEDIDNLCALGKSIGVLIKDISSNLRDLIIVKNCKEPNKILCLPDSYFNELKQIADSTNSERLLRSLQIFSEAENDLRYSNNPRIILESASIKCCRPDCDYNLDALLSRIKYLEDKINNIKNIDVRTAPTDNVEMSKQQKNTNIVSQKKFLQEFLPQEIKGKILVGLRSLGREMLWNIMQNVDVQISGNILYLLTINEGDSELLNKEASKNSILECLTDIQTFELQINFSSSEKKLSQIDEATERMKKFFGDDIIRVKD